MKQRSKTLFAVSGTLAGLLALSNILSVAIFLSSMSQHGDYLLISILGKLLTLGSFVSYVFLAAGCFLDDPLPRNRGLSLQAIFSFLSTIMFLVMTIAMPELYPNGGVAHYVTMPALSFLAQLWLVYLARRPTIASWQLWVPIGLLLLRRAGTLVFGTIQLMAAQSEYPWHLSLVQSFQNLKVDDFILPALYILLPLAMKASKTSTST